MLSFFKKAPKASGTALEQTIKRHLRDVDDDGLHGVAAVAGLVMRVAMEDDEFAAEEENLVRGKLLEIGSLGEAGARAVLDVMRTHAKTIAEVEAADYARWLADKRDRDFRLAVLQLLVDVAQAHEGIAARELDALGRVALEMKLEADDLAKLLPA
jgi:hypothetical protein